MLNVSPIDTMTARPNIKRSRISKKINAPPTLDSVRLLQAENLDSRKRLKSKLLASTNLAESTLPTQILYVSVTDDYQDIYTR